MKFVDDDTNLQEGEKRARNTKEELNKEELLHLYKLTCPIKTLHYPSWDEASEMMGWKDISHHNNFDLEPLVPPGENECMFKFPYKEVGRRFDLSTLDLSIFGH